MTRPYAYFQTHPRWDAASLRILLTADELMKFPVIKITPDALYEIRKQIDFNPVNIYMVKIELYPGEVGHDLMARYVSEKND